LADARIAGIFNDQNAQVSRDASRLFACAHASSSRSVSCKSIDIVFIVERSMRSRPDPNTMILVETGVVERSVESERDRREDSTEAGEGELLLSGTNGSSCFLGSSCSFGEGSLIPYTSRITDHWSRQSQDSL